jgi:hypothetical protein
MSIYGLTRLWKNCMDNLIGYNGLWMDFIWKYAWTILRLWTILYTIVTTNGLYRVRMKYVHGFIWSYVGL